MFSLLWSEHCSYKHSQEAAAHAADRGRARRHGPGRERGRRRRRRRPGRRVQGRVAQPPERGRAVPGRGHRRRRHPARHLRHRRAADRGARLAALRRAHQRRARATCSTTPSPGSATTATRSASRRSAARSTSRARTSRTASSTRWRSASPTQDRMIRSAAAGVGNVVVLFGASTGRDGIGGASVLASAELGIDEDKRPTVQVGDPFAEKKLLECSLELLERGLLVSLQDLGAAGLTSSSAEMASKGEVGLDLDVAKVPLREADMEPFEIMVCESQERMLCVVEPDARRRGARGLREVGGPRDRDRRRHRQRAPARAATATASSATCRSSRSSTTARSTTSSPAAPVRRRCTPPPRGDARRGRRRARDAPRAARVPEHRLAAAALPAVRLDRAVADRAPPGRGRRRGAAAARRQRDRRRDRRLRPARRRRPVHGHGRGVLECAANLACVGAEPLGLTNCLNFGNPEKPHIAWQLTESIRGLGDACRALDVPVVGGNVSLYNEGAEGPIYPTPVVGMVGELPDAARAGRAGVRAGGRRGRPRRPVRARPAGVRAGQAARRGAARRPAGGRHLRRARGARGGPRRGPRRHAVERARHRRGRPRWSPSRSAPGRRRRRARDDRAGRRRLGAAVRRGARPGLRRLRSRRRRSRRSARRCSARSAATA